MNATGEPISQPGLQSATRPVRTWRAWLLLVLIAPALLIGLSIAAIFLIMVSGAGQHEAPSVLSENFPYLIMVNHALLLLIALLLARFDRLNVLSLGWRQQWPGWVTEILVGLLAGAAIFCVQILVMQPAVAALRQALGTGSLRPSGTPTLQLNLASLIAGTIFAGVVEETVYRGYIQRQLVVKLGPVWGILITTLGFTVGLHWGLGPFSLVVVFVNGLLLALLFQWRKNLLSCAIAHAVVNATVVALM